MSRTISLAVLLAVIAPSLLILTNVVTPVPESKLPACCRRGGEHHCAMAVGEAPSAETQIKSESPVCPFRSQDGTVAFAVAYLPAPSAILFASLESHPSVHEQTHAAGRVSQARCHQKRGPPTAA